MRIEIPREIERFGPIIIHNVQKVYELDAGLKSNIPNKKENSVISRISYETLHDIQEQMAIIVPVKNERIKLIEGVLSAIPHHCLTILVSNSPREPIDRYQMEVDAIEHAAKFMEKNLFIVHQKDLTIAQAFEESGYKIILDENGEVKNGKAEGMILGTILAYLCNKKYIGFIDSDNYFPGSVHEYVQEYSAAFSMSKTKYSMARISWHSKPKVVESSLFFAKRGRASEHTNNYLNKLLAYYTGYGTEIIKTGNAGEHAITMDLAVKMDFSSGYSIEPYHFINLMEKYGGVLPHPAQEKDKSIMKKHIEIFQIESRNPHLHEVKGDEHVHDMSKAAMEVIYRSPLCPNEMKKEIIDDLVNRNLMKRGEEMENTIRYYPAVSNANLKKFAEVLKNEPYANQFERDLSKFNSQKDLEPTIEKLKKVSDKLPTKGKLEAK